MGLANIVPEAVVAIYSAIKTQRLVVLAVMALIGRGGAADQERWRAAVQHADMQMARVIRRKEVAVSVSPLGAVVGIVPAGRVLLHLLSSVEVAFYRTGGQATTIITDLESVVFFDETGRLLVGPAADVVGKAAAESIVGPHFDAAVHF